MLNDTRLPRGWNWSKTDRFRYDFRFLRSESCGWRGLQAKLYRFLTILQFHEVKTGPKLTVSGTIFQFIRKIGPKVYEIGMNFEFLFCQEKTETPECFFDQVPALGWPCLLRPCFSNVWAPSTVPR
jgi:hypothetical protein